MVYNYSMSKFIVELYEKPNGKKPIDDFISGLDNKLISKILRDISVLSLLGYELKEPNVKYIDKGIFELRTQVANNAARIFYFFYVNNRIVLTNGFIKKTQKMPKKEFELALKYKKDYEKENN